MGNFSKAIRYLSTLLTAFLFAVAPVNVASADHNDNEIIVNLDNSYAPYMYGDLDFPLGLYAELIQSTFDKMNTNAQIQVVPWKRAIHMVNKGTAGIGGLYKTDDRQQKYDFSIPIYTESLAVYTKLENIFSFHNVQDLKNKTVGLNLGWSYGNEIDIARTEKLFRVYEVKNNTHGLLMLSRGRIDVAIIDQLSAMMILSKSPHKNQIAQLKYPAAINEVYIAFNKSANMRPFLDQFDQTFMKLKMDGDIVEIINRFIQQKPSSS